MKCIENVPKERQKDSARSCKFYSQLDSKKIFPARSLCIKFLTFLYLGLEKETSGEALKIVSISFDFDNEKLLSLLNDRAEYLKDGNYE